MNTYNINESKNGTQKFATRAREKNKTARTSGKALNVPTVPYLISNSFW